MPAPAVQPVLVFEKDWVTGPPNEFVAILVLTLP